MTYLIDRVKNETGKEKEKHVKPNGKLLTIVGVGQHSNIREPLGSLDTGR
jgi:hypothetical protein